jgi:phosphoribosylformimino-5-aminoimidazole carboxamide ribotide isomerase
MSADRHAPRLIPVLDVMNGHAVRAVGGRREDYQPILCPFTSSRKVYDVASAILQLAKANELYIADLDAIMGKVAVSRGVQTTVEMWPVTTWLDAGIGRKLRVSDLPNLPHVRPVVGSETCATPEDLRTALAEAGERPLAFSIDLKGGRLLGQWANWGLEGPFDVLRLARQVVELGVRTLIVLDLARVGTGTGTGTEPLLRAIRNEFPNVDLIAGGGVRTWADVERLGGAGATGVLVASALHDGTLWCGPVTP